MFQTMRDVGSVVVGLERLAEFGRSDRFDAYRGQLLEFVASGLSFADVNEHERPLLRHAYSESHEVLNILDALSSLERPQVVRREMLRVLAGDVSPRRARHYVELAGSVEQASEMGELESLRHLVEAPIENLGTRESNSADIQSTEEAPRNFAFELWLATLIHRAGLRATKAEPDWVVDARIGPVGIAAKRIQRNSALGHRVREASAQIAAQDAKGATVGGLVAVDLTLAYDLHRKHWVVRRAAETGQLHLTIASVLQQNRAVILNAIRNRPGVIGVVLHAKALVFVRETQTLATVRPILVASTVAGKHPHAIWLTEFAASIQP
ncbi:MAG: hypothetical protein IAE78_14085 [Myxococcus sp.]|nr:hypothetical protein [Myxococcus sp.]